ncbi:hypothetical protein [Clostridium thermobutyricum]|uniref:hypothetical protein n=1 Tax=Clostridium thermobutyricum TaxID=29372 RepID=UPI0018AAE6DC|nr:hypothetical protein [Clostridium thermobutyricum]
MNIECIYNDGINIVFKVDRNLYECIKKRRKIKKYNSSQLVSKITFITNEG